jgi:hypothetical protein
LISTCLIISGKPLDWLPANRSWDVQDLLGLLILIGCLIAVMLPFDLLGGFLLPNRSRPNTIHARSFIRGWVRGVAVQSSIFLSASLLILMMGRSLGLPGAVLVVFGVALFLIAFQLRIARLTAILPISCSETSNCQAAVAEALERTSDWGLRPRPILVLEHKDIGFTGGVVGLPGAETIIIPAAAVNRLLPEQLAIMIARRLEAIHSGSRTRGMLLAVAWVITGFTSSAILPGAGVTSVGELAMTCMGFTLWTFLGLLILPTLSRQASYAIDRRVMNQGAPAEALYLTLERLDRLQDDEPKRPALIEKIFHPVPSLDNRRSETGDRIPIAWHAARMTLLVSWACMGTLVRAVHCNAGRPELWVMLPTD